MNDSMPAAGGSAFGGKIVFFGTANVALPILEELKKQHEIVAVVTTPDVKIGRKQLLQESPVSALAVDLKLPLYKPENIKNNPEFLELLKGLNADIFVVVAYGKILPLDIINLPPHKTVNVHFSVLPKYRGPSPIQAALQNGDSQTGTSIFVLDQQVDTGPLIAQEIVEIAPDDNFFTLSDRLAKVSAKIVNSTLENYISGSITPLPQDESKASYTKLVNKKDGQVNWQMSADEIYNQFRAFYIWPGVWTTWKGLSLKIPECLPVTVDTKNAAIGTVLDQGNVVCGQNTALRINRLQLAGKNEVSMQEFLNGYANFVGSVLK